MIERDPNIVQSGLSRTVTRDGVTVEVSIIRLEHETQWSLEVSQFRRRVHSLGRTLCNRRRCLRRIRADCRRGRDAGVPRQRKRDPNAPLIATCAKKSAASRVFRGRPSTPQRLCAEEGRSRPCRCSSRPWTPQLVGKRTRHNRPATSGLDVLETSQTAALEGTVGRIARMHGSPCGWPRLTTKATILLTTGMALATTTTLRRAVRN